MNPTEQKQIDFAIIAILETFVNFNRTGQRLILAGLKKEFEAGKPVLSFMKPSELLKKTH